MQKGIKAMSYIGLATLWLFLFLVVGRLIGYETNWSDISQSMASTGLGLFELMLIVLPLTLFKSEVRQEFREMIDNFSNELYEKRWCSLVENSHTKTFWWCQLYHLGVFLRYVGGLLFFFFLVKGCLYFHVQLGLNYELFLVLCQLVMIFVLFDLVAKLILAFLKGLGNWMTIGMVFRKIIILLILMATSSLSIETFDQMGKGDGLVMPALFWWLGGMIVSFYGLSRGINYFFKKTIQRVILYGRVNNASFSQERLVDIKSIHFGPYQEVLTLEGLTMNQSLVIFRGSSLKANRVVIDRFCPVTTILHVKTRYGGCPFTITLPNLVESLEEIKTPFSPVITDK
ncbi:hypothetical protein CIC46_10080 [Listeria monocytogenes]|nr:hypothetical protein [Listeria monocytogenes]